MEDPTELELGICVYRSDGAGFSAVLKARYSDFLVHEVGLDGTVARLDSLDPKLLLDKDGETVSNQSSLLGEAAAVREEEPTKKPKLDPNDDNDDNDDARTPVAAAISAASTTEEPSASSGANTNPSLDWDKLKTELEGLVGSEAALSTVAFLQESQAADSDGNTETPQSQFVMLPASSKEARRALHEWIRKRLEPVALSDTENGCVRLWLKRYERNMSNYNTFNNNNSNNNDRPGKRRRDSQESSPPGFLRFVVYKENMDTGTAMHHLQQSLQPPPPGRRSNPRQRRPLPRVRLGFAGMKDKRGVTSQFVTLALDQSHRAPQVAENLCRRWNQGRPGSTGGDGGGHTQSLGVGVLRVGRFERVPDELRLGSLRGNRFDIVLRNLREQATVVTQAAEKLRHTGFVNYFGVQRFGKYHDTHRVGMAVLRGDYRAATDIILGPRPDEPDPVHQARLEWHNRFAHGPEKDGGEAEAERRCAQTIVKQFSRFMNTEVALLQSLARHPLDYQRAFKCIAKTMRMMFLHAVQSYVWNHTASHRLQMIGDDVVEGDLVLGDAAAKINNDNVVRLVTKDDVDSRKFTLEDIVLPIIGTNTADPSNSCGAFMYELLDKQQLSKQMFHDLNDRDLDVKGDYRKLLCHPTDVDFELLHYSYPLQPLVQTDLMLLQKLPINAAPNGEKTSLHAIRVGFTLPPSSYATIALRELLKRPTSSNYQSEQKLDNEND